MRAPPLAEIEISGSSALARAFRDPNQLLADDDSHAPAEEPEIEGGDGDLVTVQPRETRDERVRLAGLCLQGQQVAPDRRSRPRSEAGRSRPARGPARESCSASTSLTDCGSSRLAVVIAAGAADPELVGCFVARQRPIHIWGTTPAEMPPHPVLDRSAVSGREAGRESIRLCLSCHSRGHRCTPTVC